ncbi:hypothetical protein FGO68_gene6127 [Halteria grandinella]|uniref:Uncharacterized protein n=1 Tax=Halteria grandinella TaxID=5974 RepID=A0A8J8P2G3_HALGN|nr:hypothetical protein FGO68_gene6127 [Halteria grandinella]
MTPTLSTLPPQTPLKNLGERRQLSITSPFSASDYKIESQHAKNNAPPSSLNSFSQLLPSVHQRADSRVSPQRLFIHEVQQHNYYSTAPNAESDHNSNSRFKRSVLGAEMISQPFNSDESHQQRHYFIQGTGKINNEQSDSRRQSPPVFEKVPSANSEEIGRKFVNVPFFSQTQELSVNFNAQKQFQFSKALPQHALIGNSECSSLISMQGSTSASSLVTRKGAILQQDTNITPICTEQSKAFRINNRQNYESISSILSQVRGRNNTNLQQFKTEEVLLSHQPSSPFAQVTRIKHKLQFPQSQQRQFQKADTNIQCMKNTISEKQWSNQIDNSNVERMEIQQQQLIDLNIKENAQQLNQLNGQIDRPLLRVRKMPEDSQNSFSEENQHNNPQFQYINHLRKNLQAIKEQDPDLGALVEKIVKVKQGPCQQEGGIIRKSNSKMSNSQEQQLGLPKTLLKPRLIQDKISQKSALIASLHDQTQRGALCLEQPKFSTQDDSSFIILSKSTKPIEFYNDMATLPVIDLQVLPRNVPDFNGLPRPISKNDKLANFEARLDHARWREMDATPLMKKKRQSRSVQDQRDEFNIEERQIKNQEFLEKGPIDISRGQESQKKDEINELEDVIISSQQSSNESGSQQFDDSLIEEMKEQFRSFSQTESAHKVQNSLRRQDCLPHKRPKACKMENSNQSLENKGRQEQDKSIFDKDELNNNSQKCKPNARERFNSFSIVVEKLENHRAPPKGASRSSKDVVSSVMHEINADIIQCQSIEAKLDGAQPQTVIPGRKTVDDSHLARIKNTLAPPEVSKRLHSTVAYPKPPIKDIYTNELETISEEAMTPNMSPAKKKLAPNETAFFIIKNTPSTFSKCLKKHNDVGGTSSLGYESTTMRSDSGERQECNRDGKVQNIKSSLQFKVDNQQYQLSAKYDSVNQLGKNQQEEVGNGCSQEKQNETLKIKKTPTRSSTVLDPQTAEQFTLKLLSGKKRPTAMNGTIPIPRLLKSSISQPTLLQPPTPTYLATGKVREETENRPIIEQNGISNSESRALKVKELMIPKINRDSIKLKLSRVAAPQTTTQKE